MLCTGIWHRDLRVQQFCCCFLTAVTPPHTHTWLPPVPYSRIKEIKLFACRMQLHYLSRLLIVFTLTSVLREAILSNLLSFTVKMCLAFKKDWSLSVQSLLGPFIAHLKRNSNRQKDWMWRIPFCVDAVKSLEVGRTKLKVLLISLYPHLSCKKGKNIHVILELDSFFHLDIVNFA